MIGNFCKDIQKKLIFVLSVGEYVLHLGKIKNMTKIKFTVEQLKIIDEAMEVIEYSGIPFSSPKYKRAIQIKNKLRKEYQKQNNY